MRRLFFVVLLFWAVVLLLGAEDRQDKNLVTIVPEETDEILANPGMGWETFHQPSNRDRNLPKWLPSTVHYARWGWGELEPKPDTIDTDFLDKVLKDTHSSGQKLAFRVMCCSTTPSQPYHPKWLATVGGKQLACDYEGQGPLVIPDMDDPIVLERHLSFIKRLGDRYDGHADIDHVDIGSIGWWGEWHLSGSKKCVLCEAEMPPCELHLRQHPQQRESAQRTRPTSCGLFPRASESVFRPIPSFVLPCNRQMPS